MGVRHAAVLIGTALILSAVVVPLASANGPMGGIEDVIMSIPDSGSGIATRAPMPATSKVGTIGVTASGSTADDFISHVTTVLTAAPTRGARVVVCVLLYAQLTASGVNPGPEAESLSDPTIQDLFLDVCIHIALSIQQQQTSGAAHMLGKQPAARCGMRDLGVPVTISRSGSKYVATVNGTPFSKKPKGLRISCTHTATGLKIVERPRSKKAKLAKVTGPILGVGFSSGSTSAGKLKVSLGVR